MLCQQQNAGVTHLMSSTFIRKGHKNGLSLFTKNDKPYEKVAGTIRRRKLATSGVTDQSRF
jgi:hypothetical protein